MLIVLTIAVIALALVVRELAKSVRALRNQIADQAEWINGISEEVRRLPETLRDSEALRQMLELANKHAS